MKATRTAFAAAASMAAFFMAAPAAADEAGCTGNAEMVAALAAKYGESRAGYGIGNRGALIEIYVNDESGSWTLVVTSATGVSCAVIAGQLWQPERKGKGT